MAGKGSKDNRTPDYEKRAESWDRIFGKKDKPVDDGVVSKTKNQPHEVVDHNVEDDAN